MHDYSGHEEQQSQDQMRQLTALVDKLDNAEAICEQLEEQLKAAQQVARELRENTIPELMQSIGVKEITTESGVYVALKEEVRASFFTKEPEKRLPAYEWLRENHHDGLIKNQVSVQFNREQDQLAAKFVEYCRQFDVPVNLEQKQEIHHQTLLAFLREQIREGAEVPLEKFGAFVQKFAKVKRK